MRAQRAEQNGRFWGDGGLPQIGHGRGELAELGSIAERYNQTGAIWKQPRSRLGSASMAISRPNRSSSTRKAAVAPAAKAAATSGLTVKRHRRPGCVRASPRSARSAWYATVTAVLTRV